MNSHSAIYAGTVNHRRHQPFDHLFNYRLFMVYLDLDELEGLLPESPLWSIKRPALVRFRREDYHGQDDIPLIEAVRNTVEKSTGSRPHGPVRMLTHLRYFGYCFNPVTFYYCFDSEGRDVETVMAEITNTPWKERHCYVLSRSGRASEGSDTLRFGLDKQFHVSPFMDMDHRYRWDFSRPADRLWVNMQNHTANGRYFDATLMLKRIPLTGIALARATAAYPLMTFKVFTAIHFQALKLWLKGAPYYPHPKHRKRTGQEGQNE